MKYSKYPVQHLFPPVGGGQFVEQRAVVFLQHLGHHRPDDVARKAADDHLVLRADDRLEHLLSHHYYLMVGEEQADRRRDIFPVVRPTFSATNLSRRPSSTWSSQGSTSPVVPSTEMPSTALPGVDGPYGDLTPAHDMELDPYATNADLLLRLGNGQDDRPQGARADRRGTALPWPFGVDILAYALARDELDAIPFGECLAHELGAAGRVVRVIARELAAGRCSRITEHRYVDAYAACQGDGYCFHRPVQG